VHSFIEIISRYPLFNKFEQHDRDDTGHEEKHGLLAVTTWLPESIDRR